MRIFLPNQNKNDEEGFTLIEIIGVIMLITLILGIAVPTLRSQYRYYIRSNARTLAATFAFLYDAAIIQNRTYRIVYDLDNKKFWVESAAGKILIEEEEEEEISEEKAATSQKFKKEEGRLSKEKKLGKGVSFMDVTLPRIGEPVIAGKAYTYILPTGYVEETWIHLEDESGQVFTITVNPLTGRATTYARLVQPEQK
ncbi:Tfp pilus assembly protein FimT/FimU [Bdellovibrionota bacterium]